MDAEQWELGSQTDELRNQFVIPCLSRIMERNQPATILDVGAGTGYVAREIDKRLSFRAEWTLIDLSGERLQLASSRRPDAMILTTVLGNFNDSLSLDSSFAAILVSFTLLEMEVEGVVLERLSSLCVDGGLLVIVLPDVWRDVLDAAESAKHQARQFLVGSVDLQKVDKFTGVEYPFKAERIESVISRILAAGFALESLEQGGVDERMIFVLAFRRRQSGDELSND